MAEFKLGRIRFVWQGDWTTDRAYVADDVVSFGGKSYICIRNHTSSGAFNSDFDNEIPKWDIVSDGTKWRGEWEPEVEYAPGDVVKYGSLVYIAETGHVSATFEAPDFLGLEENLDNWTPFATSFDWKGDWVTDTRFKINDLVRYGGFVYLCTTAHISASTATLGLENDQGKWELFSDGLVYLGDWVTATRYKVNDVVKYGGNVFICVAPHTSDDFLTDETNWDVFIEGFQFEDSWNNSTVYQIGDTVTYGGYVYVAKTNNSAAQPTASPLDWEVFTTGFSFQGDWNSLDSYKVGDVIRLGGTTYVAIADSTDFTPPNNTYWSKLNSGINWTNSTQTFLQVQGTNALGSGSGARFDVIKSKTVYTVTVSTGFAGTGYSNNDIVTIAGNLVGGTSPANDIEITITGETSGAVDSISQSGYSSTWTTGTNYVVGDVVIYGASSFIATATHAAETSNRPDNDLAAEYWNLLALGSEALSLTTEGDMVYYGNQGPTRLPIGVDGQILRATGGLPDWANYGLVDNVVYVGPLGANEPAPRSGLSIDKPWASVRYALDQVRNGYLNPQAKQILQNNKQFFKKEVTSWIDYTYKVIVTETVAASRQFTTYDTSNLRDGMPIEFDGVTIFGNVVEGQTYYIDSVISSTTFRIAETPGGISFIPTDGNGVMTGKLSYDAAKCERDTGYLVDAMIYDIGRGGTLRTTEVANSYYTEAGNEYISSNLGNQRVQTIEAYEHLKELVAEVLNNEKPVSYQSLTGIAIENRAAQVIDLTLIAEAIGKSKAAGLIDIVNVGLEAESNTAIPLPQLPNTTVFIKTGTYNEILPIIIPEYTAIVGDELRTSVVQPQPPIAILANDKNKTTSALNRIKDVSEKIIQNITIDSSEGNTASQRYLNGYGGATTSTQRLDQSVSTVLNILENGIEEIALLPEVGPTPTGGSNNASDVGFANAVAQIEANINFIVAEQTAWIQAQVDGVIAPFASDFTFDTANCERDTRYILDALRYDLTYGGNLETTVAARSYFVDGNPVYGTGKKEETLATYAHLKSIVSDIVIEAAITPSAGNSETQNTDGTAGSATAETFVDDRIQEIFDTVDTDGTLPTPILPDTSWVASPLTAIAADINTDKTTLQNSVIDFTNTNYGKFVYNSASCRRDAGILKTGAAYDIALGSNFNAIRNGLAYRRSYAGEKVLEEQITETLGAIAQEGVLVGALISDTTAITRNDTYWLEVADIVENNTPNAIVYTDSGTATKTTARTELQTNRAAIISDLISWINSNYPALAYDETLCERDSGYIIDAISYDVQYGGNSASVEAAKAYFNGYIEVLPTVQRERTAAAIEQLAVIAATYMSGATEETEVATLVQIVADVVRAGDIIALPATTYPDITWATAPIQTDTNAVLNDTSVVPALLQYITDNYTGFIYNHTKCSRDTGYIIDGLRYDIMFGSKFRSIKSGMSYRRAISSAEVVIETQLEATLGAIDHLRREIRDITSGTNKITSNTTIIKDIVVNNNVPAYTITDPTGYNTGFSDARRLVFANKAFLQAEAVAYMNTNFNSLWTGLTADERAKSEADVGLIIDALRYDLTYRGNLETIVSARAFYVDGVYSGSADQKTTALEIQDRLVSIIDDIATATSISKSAGNAETQDVSGTAGSAGAAAFSLDRITEIRNTIDTGILPALINPTLDWVDSGLQEFKTAVDSRRALIQAGAIDYINIVHPTLDYDEEKCARDVGYMIDAVAYDVIFNSNFRSTTSGKAYQRGITSTEIVLDNQLGATIDTIDYINEALTELTIGVDTTIGQDNAAKEAFNLVKDMTTIIQNGLNSVPPIKFPSPIGYEENTLIDTAYATTTNTSGDSATYSNAAAQLLANRDFISDELQNWLVNPANGYDNIWTVLSANAQERCIRDAQFIVDAVRYDLTYGGNTQANVAGSAYYSNFRLTIENNELAATLASYARLREIVGEIIAETTVTTSPGVTETQNTSGTAGNAAAIEFAEERIDDITYYLQNAEPNLTVEVATAWQLTEFTTAYERVVDRKDEIVEDVVYWVEKFYQDLEYNQATCRRDVGLIVDALARDVVTGSNFATTKAGMAYYRAVPSALKTLKEELSATVGAMNFLAEKVKRVALTAPNEAIKQLVTDITSYIDGGALPTPKWIDTNFENNPDICGASTIWENKEYIQEEVLEYLSQNYTTQIYAASTIKTNLGYLVDALRYDLTFGGEAAIYKFIQGYHNGAVPDESTLVAYDYAKFVAMALAANSVDSPGSLQTRVAPKLRDAMQITGDAGTVTRVEEIMTQMYNDLSLAETYAKIEIVSVISNVFTSSTDHNLTIGSEINLENGFGLLGGGIYFVKSIPTNDTFTISAFFNGPESAVADDPSIPNEQFRIIRTPDLTSVTANLRQQFTNIQGSKAAMQEDVTDYIREKFPTLDYDQAKCERDVGLIIDAVGRDMLLNSNYLTTQAALSYFNGTQADVVIKEQRLATVQAYRELKNFITTYVTGEGTSVNYGGRNDNSSAKVRINNLMDIVINIIEKGANVTPEFHGTITYFNDRETINAVDALKVNKDFLGEEATAWIKANFGGIVTSITGSPGTLTFTNAHNLQLNDPIVFTGTVFGGIELATTYYVSNVTSTTDIEVSGTLGGESINTFVGGVGSMTASYDFDEAACKRDMSAYIDAMVYDLQYPGNYHSLRAARLYVNAVDGSQYEDMFYVRNATGCRNMTLNGLRGNLSEKNQFGTRRPTGGAYVSLDPGFGPNDTEAWVTNKSCYVQNVSTFGTGCVGNKIDGSLHAGGNRSVVSNDFTQILSDGIGVWCSGNNSLTELVSVFAYYNYAGYLADYGGRIRATNGNSSYGTFGTIAEGTDLGEEPIVADADNLSQNALVYAVQTDGEEEVLAMEYSNAGTGYTNVQYAISGTGFNAATQGDEFRDQGLVEARIIDVDDGTEVGGEDYVIAQNVAQGGSPVYIILAATDFALGDAYNGMRVQVTAGTGVGQYGTVLNFNNGTKGCTVYKPSFDNLTATATSATGNVITVADTTTLYVDMPIYFDADIGGLARGDSLSNVYYVKTIPSATTFTVSDSVGGITEVLTNDTGNVTVYAAGFDNVIPGKPSENSLDLTTGYTVEPSIKYAKPGFTAASVSTADAIDFGPGIYADRRFIAIEGGAGASTNYSTDGETWATGGALPASANWSDVTFGGGQGATARAVIGGLGGSGAVLEAELGELNSIGLPGPTQIARVNVVAGGTGYVTPPTIVFTATLGGGGATAVATVKDGAIQNVIITSTGAGYAQAPTVAAETDKLTEVVIETRGKGYQSPPTVTITGGGATTQAQVIATTENTGVTSIVLDVDIDDNPLFGEGYTTTPTVEIVDNDAKWVAVANGSTTNAYLAASSALNANWTAGTAFTASHYIGITYGNGTFVAVGSAGGADAAQTSTNGNTWTPRVMTTPASGTFSAVRYGGGRFVAINTDGYTAYSNNGILWTAGGNMPSAIGNWTSLAWGNGRFVAISTIGEYAISYDYGTTWYSEGTTLNNISATGWTRVAYGQGLFVAVCDNIASCAISSDGIIWTKEALSGTASWSTPIFGNPDNVPTWVTLTSDANTTANKLKTGAKAFGRCYAEDGTIIATTLLEPGSGYPVGSIVSFTTPNTIELDSTDNMYVGQPITFEGVDLAAAALNSEILYYVSDITGTDIEVSLLSGGSSYDVETINQNDMVGSTFAAGPLVTITDPSSTASANINPRIRNGVLGQPTFTNRGSGYTSATAELGGDGSADLYQPSTFIAVRGLFELPEPGSNVEFANIPEKYYKLVTISNVIGQEGSYTATLQISPGLDVLTAPKDGTVITTTNKYSQVRLTGHDFLYIGTGNKAQTNYPFVDITKAYIEAQQLSSGGGRVFYTSTDQDGNFNVGGLFGVQQSTGTATLDADAFNLAGLQSLQINGLGLGIGSAIVTQFSTDPFFTENSDNIVPTQRAIKSYITAQIGGGQSSLNVNTLTAGTVFIANNEITTTSGGQLNIKAKMNFTGGVDGAPVALGYFLSR